MHTHSTSRSTVSELGPVEWTGPYRDQRAVFPDGRILRVWFADPEWKCSIGEKKACPRGVSYASREIAREAVVKEAEATT